MRGLGRFIVAAVGVLPRLLLRSMSSFNHASVDGAAASLRRVRRVVILPGNGGGGSDVRESNWYGWLEAELKAAGDVDVVLRNMPDPDVARESVWVPFVRGDLVGGTDEASLGTVLVGHSSGAEAAMRYAERFGVAGLLLVSACHTDLGVASEAAAEYYARPWDWEAIRRNCGFIAQFHGDDDPFIPMAEARHVADRLNAEFHVVSGGSHFFARRQPRLLRVLNRLRAAPRVTAHDALGRGGGAVEILGFGSLLSEASARVTFPDLRSFRFVRVEGWRRVFQHPAAIFFDRGLVAHEQRLRCASLSVERDDAAPGFLASCFSVPGMDAEAFARFEEREEEFDLVFAPYHGDGPGQGHAILCAASSDERYVQRWGADRYAAKYKRHVDTIWGWTAGIEPCAVYLRHCVLAATKAADPRALDSFLDETFLVDCKTTIRTYLQRNPDVMDTEPPDSLRARYSG